MMYLKKFEGVEELTELKEFCNVRLAYLLDEGFSLQYYTRYIDGEGIDIEFSNISNQQYNSFSWEIVKDYYIPFLQTLIKKYKLLIVYKNDNFICVGTFDKYIYYSPEDVILDKIDDKQQIYSISLKVSIPL